MVVIAQIIAWGVVVCAVIAIIYLFIKKANE